MKNFLKRNAKIIIITTVLVIALTASFVALYPKILTAANNNPTVAYYKLTLLEKMVQKNHIYASDDDEVIRRAYELYTDEECTLSNKELRKSVKKLLQSDIENFYTLANLVLSDYDKYSSLKTEEEYNMSYPDSEGYKGLGLAVSDYGPFIRVDSVYENSSANRAGFEEGDLIFSIGGTDIRNLDYEEARILLSDYIGEEPEEIGVLRNGEAVYMMVGDDEVIVPNVSWSIDGDVGILTITLFQESSFKDDLNEAFDAFEENDIKNIILDLRDNRGGYIDYAVYLLNKFNDNKDELMFSQNKRSKGKEYLSNGTGYSFDNVVILVNENTCSAAEISSGSLKDRGYTLVGTTTYGKAIGLTTYNFFGDKLTLATLKIELPQTGDYNEIGIEPDIYIENQLSEPYKPSVKSVCECDEGSSADDILAFETALHELGFFMYEPDTVWDEKTDNAVEYVKGICEPSETVAECINSMLSELSQAVYIEDTQLETAMQIIEENIIEPAA